MNYFLKIAKKLSFNSNYNSLVRVEISKSRLLHNLLIFQQLNKNIEISPVLKSNAYGHDLVLVAKVLDKQNLPFFVVDSYYEALLLRKNGIKTPVLIIGYTFFENLAKNRQKDLIFIITSLDQLREISLKLAKKTRFHLKIDTGMHRQGVLFSDLSKAIELIRSNKNIILEGVCSHLAQAENKDSVFTKDQVELWNKVVVSFLREFKTVKYYHLENTAGCINKLTDKQNVCRIGIGLYGVDLNNLSALKPVLCLKTVISSKKSLRPGDTVGYNGTFKADSKKVIATIPIGYYEGINRKLSNKGFVYVKDKEQKIFCPIIGNVSMNITIIDINQLNNKKINQEVVAISSDANDLNSVVNLAKLAGVLPYEILVQVPSILKRNLVD